jgi:hypothetical protein
MRKVMLLVAVFGFSHLLWAADPIVGTWKSNVSKSKPATIGDWMKEATVVFREVGDQFEFDLKGTLINGSSISQKGNRPLVGGVIKVQPPNAKGISAYVTVIGPGDAYVTTLNNGKQTVVDHYVVSKDGKTLTVQTIGTDAKGKRVEALNLLERQ